MKIEMKGRFRKSSLAILLVFASVMAILFFTAISARGIPLGFDRMVTIQPATTTYSMVSCANFQVQGALKKVCAGPGSLLPEIGEDKESFEDNFMLMMVLGGKEIPFTSWLYVVKPDPESHDLLVNLFNGERIYAVGIGDTFATAMDDLRANFEEEGGSTSASTPRKDISI